MDEKVKELEDDEEEEEEKEEGRKEQTTENKSEYSSEIQKAPHSILDDYDLRGFKRFSYLFHHQPSTETDSFEMFQSVSSTKFLENLDDFKHSTSGSWKSVISSFEDVNTTNNSNNHKNNHHQTPEASSYSSKSMEAKSNIDNSSHTTMNAQLKQEPQTDDLQNVKEHLDDSFKSLSNTSKDNSSRISYPDVTMHKTDSLDNVTRRFEVRKHSKSSLLSNNQFRRTKFLKQKYADPNNNHNDDHDHDSTDGIPRSSSKLKRTATEHITNRYKYHDRTESSSIHHPNDNIPVNPIVIRRKSTIHCLYPRHYSDAMKQDECLNSQTMIYEDINKNDKHSMMGMVNPNSSHSNNIPEFDTHLNEYRLSEDLKSSFEKEDEMKADNLLEREAHIGALALAWASGTHKSKKSPYDKYSLSRETSDRVPVKLRQHNNNNNHNYNHHHSRSTVISPDNFRFNNYTTNNNMSSKNRMTLSTLRELSTSIFTPSKRNLITSSIHHQNATHRQKACYPIDETDRLHHDEKNIPITTTTTTTQNNNSSISSSHKNKTDHHLIPQSIKHAIIRNTAKIAISPILHTNEENDNDEHLHTFKPSNEHSYDSIESDQLEQFNRKDDHLHESHPTEEPPPYRQQHQQSEELRKLVDNGSQLILHSQKSSLQSEQLHDINGIFETNDNDETNRPIGIRAKIRRNAEDLRSLYGTSGPLGSVQPQMNYRSSSRGIGWRLHWRKIFNERRRKLADYSLFFAVMGILLMVFELEMIMAKVYLRTSIYSILIKSLISASTLILVGLTLVYHAVDVQLFCINNCIEDWRIAMNCRKISLTLIEVFICLIHPPPILSNYNIYSYRNSYYTLSTLGSFKYTNDHDVDDPADQESLSSASRITMKSYYDRPMTTLLYDSLLHNHTQRLNEYLPFTNVPYINYHHSDNIHYDDKPVPIIILELIFSVPMFLRLYLIFRVLLLHSTMFTDAGSRSIGALNRVKINVRFVLKTLATICPGTMLLIFILSMWIVTSWIMRVCEREQNKEYEKLLNSMWLIAVTFLSIGYGDMVPNTNCGRAISVLAGVMGSACTALVVAVVARKLELTRAEKHVHNFMQDNKFYKNLRHSAANVLRETWLFYKYTRLVKRVKPGRVRRHQRKFLTAISRLRKAKDNQRKLKEDANSMVDLAKLQTSIYETVNHIRADQTIFVQRLVGVEKCMSSIQSYINQMSDTFTGIIETFGTCNNIATISLEDETTSSNMNVTT
uniref:Calcium-activated potassium channel n=1 Tax=Schistosoma mansoni TaxID=6183 RepID=A0A3Q0KQN0_SCHMA